MAEAAESHTSTEDDSHSDSHDNSEEPPLKKSKIYKQKYNILWEKNPQLKGWLAPVRNNPYKAYCKICNKDLVAGLSELKKHHSSEKHLDKSKVLVSTRPITEMITTDTTSEQIKRAEIKMAAFVVEHHLSFKSMDHLSDLVSDIFPDSTIATKFTSKCTKTHSIIKHVLADEFRSEIEETLRRTKFSIIIDETTDISTKKLLAVVVRFFSDRENRLKCQFLKLIETPHSDATSLFTTLITYFEKKKIPLLNIIGYASDTTNVMFGQHHSVVSLLKEKIPFLFTMKCLCHSAHLCASHACEKLPRAIEDLVRDIYSHFSHSAKRLAEYEKFQHFTNTTPHKLLKPAQTRWLSLEQCITRILEQWSALETYFTQAAEKDRLVSTTTILAALKNPIFKLYYHFLSFVLPKFNRFTPNIHFLSNYLSSTYKAFLSCYLSPSYLCSTALDKIDPESANLLPLTSMNMGQEVSQFLVKPNIAQMKNDIMGFLQHVQLFYIEAAKQIKMRFPINDPILKSLTVLNPSTINSNSSQEVISLARSFPNIINDAELQSLDDEWREIQYLDPNDLPSCSATTAIDVDSFWGSVSKMTNTSGERRFPTVSKLMTSLLSLPHSNADLERIFSQVVLIETKTRNCLKASTLDAIVMTKSLSGVNCVDFKPVVDMYKRMNNTIYDTESSD